MAVSLLYSQLAWSQVILPQGNGQQIVQRACTRCHGLEKLAGPDGGIWPAFGPGKTHEEWERIVQLMVVYGAFLTNGDVRVVADYLTKSFPGPPRPRGVRIPGPVQISIAEWKLPTRGTRLHAAALAPDGSVWYTGEAKNLVGRFDPETREFKEFPVTPKSPRLPYGVGPHGLAADTDGNIWFAARLEGYIGKLDPRTGRVTEYRVPGPDGADPHTPVFDQKGTLWFTLQNSNMVGRLVPATGAMTLATMPTPRSQPYGIAVNSKGVPFFTLLAGRSIGRLDPATMTVREYQLPDGAGPRRLTITPDDIVWYTDYARGKLGRLDPETGDTTEWPSPGGPVSQAHGITSAGRVVWYVEGNSKPNLLVRFDTVSGQFQTWPLPSGDGVGRHITAAPDGTLWLTASEVDILSRVDVVGARRDP